MFNLFQKSISSMQLIKILEHNAKTNSGNCWKHWKSLVERDFPGTPCPAPSIDENLTEQASNERLNDHYESFYRAEEIKKYKIKVCSVILWLREVENVMTTEEKKVFSDFIYPKDTLPPTPDAMSTIRSLYNDILGKYAAMTGENENYPVSPLVCAVEQRNMTVIKALLEVGADATAPNFYKAPPIFFALESDTVDINIVCLLLEEMHKNNALTIMYDGGTVLDAIIRKGNMELIDAIIARFPNIDFNAYNTLLPTSVKENNAVMTSFLLTELKKSPDINFAKIISLIFLHLNLRSQKKEDGGYIGRHEYNPSDMTILGELLDLDVDIDATPTEDRLTPLMFAAWRDDKVAVEFLLSKGADANIMSKTGSTAKKFTTYEDIYEILDQAEISASAPQAKKIKRG